MRLPFHVTSVIIGGAIAIAFAAADLWAFHSLARDTDLTLLLAGLAAFGVTSAYSAGLNSDPTPPTTWRPPATLGMTPPAPAPAPPAPPTLTPPANS